MSALRTGDRWFHGTAAALSAGDVLVPAATLGRSVYPATVRSEVVFVTDRADEAWDWAKFACEMEGGGVPVVYEVVPASVPVPVNSPEVRADGSPYREFTTSAATIVRAIVR